MGRQCSEKKNEQNNKQSESETISHFLPSITHYLTKFPSDSFFNYYMYNKIIVKVDNVKKSCNLIFQDNLAMLFSIIQPSGMWLSNSLQALLYVTHMIIDNNKNKQGQ